MSAEPTRRLADNLGVDTPDEFGDAFAALSREEQVAALLEVMDDDAAALCRALGGPATPFGLAELVARHFEHDADEIRASVSATLDDLHVGIREAEDAGVHATADQWWDSLGIVERARVIQKRVDLMAGGADGSLDPGDVRRNGAGHRTPPGINKLHRDPEHEANGDDPDAAGDGFTGSMGLDRDPDEGDDDS